VAGETLGFHARCFRGNETSCAFQILIVKRFEVVRCCKTAGAVNSIDPLGTRSTCPGSGGSVAVLGVTGCGGDTVEQLATRTGTLGASARAWQVFASVGPRR
jgi:hypothetical protein